ncbi:MAG: peptidylprolyl isomerase [Lachnospiraceae bacterium]|nr:peptidylprolyl isomerase [Lachnospiraceae bacterium]
MKKGKIVCLLAALWLLFAGCGGTDGKDMTVVLTTGFRRDEIFRIDSVSCSLPEIMVYLTNTQNQYESVYGQEIWETELNGMTLEQNIKDTVLARMAQVKSMTLLAEENGIELSKEEKELAEQAAEEYFASLNEKEITLLGVDQDVIGKLYEEYALAQKVYDQIIQDINPEISDDEARIITVQHILFKTYTLDGTGRKVEYTDNAKASVYEKAAGVLALANDGQHDFESLIAEYSEDSIAVYSFGKGEMDPDFEAAAFNLGNNEISGIVESQFGYHIIKCLNTFDREETDHNKLKIVEQRRQEVFGQEYDAFVEQLIRLLNENLWEEVTFIHDAEVTTSDFFDVYNKYFPGKSH